MRVCNVRSVIAPLAVLLTVIGACTTEDTGFIAGDLCNIEGITVCDADGLVILECVSDGTDLFWQPKQDCINGCTEERGIAECIGEESFDQDTANTDKPNLPEAETTVTDDAMVSETEEPAADDTIVTTDELIADEDTIIVDETTDGDTLIADDVTDEDSLLSDESADEDAMLSDEDSVITDEAPDIDSAPTCIEITLPPNLSNNGSDLYFSSYTPKTGSTVLDDQFKFWTAGATYYDTPYDLAAGGNDNFATCVQCLLLGEDWDGSSFTKFYYPSAGTLSVTNSGGSDYLTLDTVTLVEVTIDDITDESTPVVGGSCITISDSGDHLLP